jgi:hypothetical protein
MVGRQMNAESERDWKEAVLPNRDNILTFAWRSWQKPLKYFGQDRLCRDGESKRASPNCKSRALPLRKPARYADPIFGNDTEYKSVSYITDVSNILSPWRLMQCSTYVTGCRPGNPGSIPGWSKEIISCEPPDRPWNSPIGDKVAGVWRWLLTTSVRNKWNDISTPPYASMVSC